MATFKKLFKKSIDPLDKTSFGDDAPQIFRAAPGDAVYDPNQDPTRALGTPDLLAAERAKLIQNLGKRRKKGRLANILTGPEGAGLPNTATKTLLGE